MKTEIWTNEFGERKPTAVDVARKALRQGRIYAEEIPGVVEMICEKPERAESMLLSRPKGFTGRTYSERDEDWAYRSMMSHFPAATRV